MLEEKGIRRTSVEEMNKHKSELVENGTDK